MMWFRVKRPQYVSFTGRFYHVVIYFVSFSDLFRKQISANEKNHLEPKAIYKINKINKTTKPKPKSSLSLTHQGHLPETFLINSSKRLATFLLILTFYLFIIYNFNFFVIERRREKKREQILFVLIIYLFFLVVLEICLEELSWGCLCLVLFCCLISLVGFDNICNPFHHCLID